MRNRLLGQCFRSLGAGCKREPDSALSLSLTPYFFSSHGASRNRDRSLRPCCVWNRLSWMDRSPVYPTYVQFLLFERLFAPRVFSILPLLLLLGGQCRASLLLERSCSVIIFTCWQEFADSTDDSKGNWRFWKIYGLAKPEENFMGQRKVTTLAPGPSLLNYKDLQQTMEVLLLWPSFELYCFVMGSVRQPKYRDYHQHFQ